MSVETSEDLLLSDIEPLPLSAPPSPPPPSHPAPAPSFHQPSVARSWPTSPLPVLASSSQVTAHLYSSLQRSREQKVKGYSALHSTSDLSGKARQVSFKLSSPDLTQMSGMADTPPPFSDRLDISEGVESSLCVYPSPGASELGKEEAGLETEQLETNLKDNLDISTAKLSNGRRHIEEMESVRGHLKMMLKTTARSLDEEETMPALSHHLEDDSFESDATTQLLNVSPALPLGGLEDLFPRYSRLRTDNVSISSSETQVLRESLERERARRKHCEKQILSLQNKALQLQQQLALAVSADRKKDIMIEQLDKTLAKVVEGWRRHEQEKSEGVRRLQEEKEAAEAAQARQQEVLARFEQSLSQAAETLDREQKHAQELQNTNKQLELELVKLRGSVEELKQERDRLRAEAEEMRAKTGKLQIQTQASQVQLEQQRDEWRQRENELQQELAVCTDQLEKERTQLREEAQTRLQQLQTELEETRRERDATRVDRALDQARFEAQRSQLEVELRLSVEQQVTERLAAIQEENAKNSAKLREQHRKQLLDLSARHERELVAQQDQFRAQLQERDERHQQITQDYDRKLSELHEELISLATTKRRLETQRAELVSRLQGMMRSHWTEALRLLTSQDQIEGTFSPLSLWDGSKPQSSSVHQDTSICGTASAMLPRR
ncbi:centrobin [Chanos chanos]|uniref:Centrobin n=1 Tax=Chanos chanos TaxID=29144 RepID=A0A6J2VG57_CHACN|nr:centrobin [Chanos chanos]